MQKIALFMMFIAAFLSGCKTKVKPEGPWVQKIDAVEVSTIVLSFSAKMKAENRLFLEDSYVTYDKEIKKIVLKYSSQKLLTFCEARLLIVEMVEEFLIRLNSAPPPCFEFEQLPLTPDNLDIKINFESYYGKYCDEQYIGLIWLQCGCVHFYAFDRKDLKLDWDHHRFEPYFKSRELALIGKEVNLPYLDKRTAPDSSKPGDMGLFVPY